MKKNINKRKLYAKIENYGNLGLIVGTTSMGICLFSANEPILISSSFLALSGMIASIAGNHLISNENMNCIDYLKKLDKEDNKKINF